MRQPAPPMLELVPYAQAEAGAALGACDGDGRRRPGSHGREHTVRYEHPIPTGIITPMNTQESTSLLTVREVAVRLGQHPVTIYRKIGTGQLSAVRIGHGPNAPLRVDEAALAELLQPVAAKGEAA